jgi:DNA-binding CsgD family transcriptional regulator
MEFEWRDLAFHREIGSAIDALDSPHFWARLTRVLERHIGFESWVALRFARHGPPLVCAEQAMPDGKIDLMFQDYLAALWQLDPFYLAAFEQHESGFYTLADVAPDNFRMTEYYQRYFRKNIVGDEVHFNVVIDRDYTMGFSLGSTRRYDEREIALLTLFSPWVLALMQQRLRHEDFGAARDVVETDGRSEPDLPTRFGMLTGKSGRPALTAREIEVAMLSLSGFSSRAIAEKLEISFETVRAHKKHIYAKLGVGSQSELFALFYEPGRIENEGAA